MIDERSSFAGEILRLPAPAREVRVAASGGPLPSSDSSFALPIAKGRLLLEVPGFFAAR